MEVGAFLLTAQAILTRSPLCRRIYLIYRVNPNVPLNNRVVQLIPVSKPVI